jgi:hypothetical protein
MPGLEESQCQRQGNIRRDGISLWRSRLEQWAASVFGARCRQEPEDRQIQQLQDRGFIVEVTKGAFSRKIRHATEWRLTEFSCDKTDALPTREYLAWPQIQKPVPVARLYGPRSGTERSPQRDNELPKAA